MDNISRDFNVQMFCVKGTIFGSCVWNAFFFLFSSPRLFISLFPPPLPRLGKVSRLRLVGSRPARYTCSTRTSRPNEENVIFQRSVIGPGHFPWMYSATILLVEYSVCSTQGKKTESSYFWGLLSHKVVARNHVGVFKVNTRVYKLLITHSLIFFLQPVNYGMDRFNHCLFCVCADKNRFVRCFYFCKIQPVSSMCAVGKASPFLIRDSHHVGRRSRLRALQTVGDA